MSQKSMTIRDEERAAERIARQIQDQLRGAALRVDRTPAPASAAADLASQLEQIIAWGLTELHEQLAQLELAYDAPQLEVDYVRRTDALRRAVATMHFQPPLTVTEYAALATHLANDVALAVRKLVEDASEGRDWFQRFSASRLNEWSRGRKHRTPVAQEALDDLYGPDEPVGTTYERGANGEHTFSYGVPTPDAQDRAQWKSERDARNGGNA